MSAIEVLLVDDSEDYVAAVTSWLAVWPELHLVGVAGSGERACEMVGELNPDLVLMDVSMPGMSGFEAVGRIKALGHAPKIIMLTLNADGPSRRAALLAGADAFVAKAEVTTTLLSAVARLFPDTAAGTTHGCTEHLLQRFANDVSAATGTAFFELLVEYIAGCLGFDVVTVGELAGEGCESVRSIAAWPPGITPDDFMQDLSGTPCERVAHGEFLTHANGVREEYPCAESIHALAIDSYIGAPLVGSDGRVIGLICGYGRGPVANQAVAEMMFRIVAGRAAAELERELSRRELERSESMFRGLIEGTHDIVALIDADDAFTYVSPAVERWLGYRPVDCAGIKVIELVHELDRPQIETLLRSTDRPGPDCLVEARIRRVDGTWRTMESSIAEHYDGAGHRFRVVTARDITERRRLEDHLQQSQKTEIIGRLTAGVAHDFGNILMVIRTHADILAMKTVEGDPKQRYVDSILDAVTRGSGLARQLTAFHRQRVFEPRHVELNASIEQMTTLLRRLVGSQIQLVSRLSPDAGVIVADPTQIEQIVLNLIINARDAMPGGGQITIETAAVPADAVPNWAGRMPGEYVRLSVTDTGCGIREDVKGRIFDPLFTTKEEGQGTGIGLATVQGIVGRHGGVIQVDTAEHRGSTFRIYLPRGPLVL
jgi:PAS domain S-box-containing protein